MKREFKHFKTPDMCVGMAATSMLICSAANKIHVRVPPLRHLTKNGKTRRLESEIPGLNFQEILYFHKLNLHHRIVVAPAVIVIVHLKLK